MKYIHRNDDRDGIDRRGFLTCMAWAGTGAVYTLTAGVLQSHSLSDPAAHTAAGALSFVQISDSHIGFNKAANTDVTATLQTAIDRINALPERPPFVIHTGDLTQLSKPDEFDTLEQALKQVRTGRIFYVPGEHDILDEGARLYRERFNKGPGGGWYSFDWGGVHFAGLVNVADLKAGGLGSLGADQIEWFEKDLAPVSSSTPVVVFAHIPLWSVYPPWGWGTEDSARALSYLRRFGSVSVLNGHIHQIMQKVEGNITFHTARSTAFPQAQPGAPAGPGPMKVPAGELRSLLGVTEVSFRRGSTPLAIVDRTLDASPKQSAFEVTINNFKFTPETLTAPVGTTVTWLNRDDEPHKVVANDHAFSSSVLDTGDRFEFRFTMRGSYQYFCSLHPMMVGKVMVD